LYEVVSTWKNEMLLDAGSCTSENPSLSKKGTRARRGAQKCQKKGVCISGSIREETQQAHALFEKSAIVGLPHRDLAEYLKVGLL
jgi:hypothetical protein